MALVKWIAAYDVHGDMLDHESNRVLFSFQEDEWKAKIRMCGGDLFDFRPLRRGAKEEEKRELLGPDVAAGLKWFKRFRPTVYLRGNHCERLWEAKENASGAVKELAEQGVNQIEEIVKRFNCQMLPYHKSKGIYRLGDTSFLHGFFCGINAARQHALVYGKCVFGHVHTIDSHSVPGLARIEAKAVGALCRLDMPYNERQPNTLRQANGFAYGLYNDKTGHVTTWQAQAIEGKWILLTDYVEL